MSWGEIYNTSWWGVALDTARTVKARPDFFGSQLNLLTSEQPNLVTNGTFDTDSDWSKGTGWSISGGKAIHTGAQSLLSQINVFTIGSKYKISFDLSDADSSNYIRLLTSHYVGGGNFSTNGSQVVYVTSNITQLYIYGVGDITIDNVSVQVARAELDQIEAKKCLADWIHTTALKDLNN